MERADGADINGLQVATATLVPSKREVIADAAGGLYEQPSQGSARQTALQHLTRQLEQSQQDDDDVCMQVGSNTRLHYIEKCTHGAHCLKLSTPFIVSALPWDMQKCKLCQPPVL